MSEKEKCISAFLSLFEEFAFETQRWTDIQAQSVQYFQSLVNIVERLPLLEEFDNFGVLITLDDVPSRLKVKHLEACEENSLHLRDSYSIFLDILNKLDRMIDNLFELMQFYQKKLGIEAFNGLLLLEKRPIKIVKCTEVLDSFVKQARLEIGEKKRIIGSINYSGTENEKNIKVLCGEWERETNMRTKREVQELMNVVQNQQISRIDKRSQFTYVTDIELESIL